MPGEFDAAINYALDEYQRMQLKAEAFDKLLTNLDEQPPHQLIPPQALLDWLRRQVG
jgi:hypothetical protein